MTTVTSPTGMQELGIADMQAINGGNTPIIDWFSDLAQENPLGAFAIAVPGAPALILINEIQHYAGYVFNWFYGNDGH